MVCAAITQPEQHCAIYSFDSPRQDQERFASFRATQLTAPMRMAEFATPGHFSLLWALFLRKTIRRSLKSPE
jgi:hypothetical protein